MSVKILNGKIVRDKRMVELVKRFNNFGIKPILVIIQIGDREDSTAYIRAKLSFGKKLGVDVKHIHLNKNTSNDEVVSEIKKFNLDQNINGIIVQLPLPNHLDRNLIINSLDSRKDVDGLTEVNKEYFIKNSTKAIIPATARGVMELLEYYKIDVKDKKVTVIGRSDLVGKPIAQLLLNKGAIVTTAHSKTVNLAKETLGADIIITAVGKVNLINSEHVRSGQIVVDVGINSTIEENDDGFVNKSRLVGDVDYDSVKDIVKAISPVPGGVGPMTVLALFENLAELI